VYGLNKLLQSFPLCLSQWPWLFIAAREVNIVVGRHGWFGRGIVGTGVWWQADELFAASAERAVD